MKKILRVFAKFMALFWTLLSVLQFVASPAYAVGERLRIDFISNPDWIEVKHVEEEPEKLRIFLVNNDGGAVLVATFNQNGPAFPEVAGILKNRVNGKRLLFAIVKWRYYLSGVDTEGDYYEVHAYEVRSSRNGKVNFIEAKKISDFYGSGFDGRQEGKVVRFRFKDASAIRRNLREIK